MVRRREIADKAWEHIEPLWSRSYRKMAADEGLPDAPASMLKWRIEGGGLRPRPPTLPSWATLGGASLSKRNGQAGLYASAVLIDLSLPECVAGLSPKFVETVLPEVNERCYTKLSAVDAWQLARPGNMRRTG